MSSFKVFSNKCRVLMVAANFAAASTAKTKTITATKAKSGNTGILKVQNVSPALAKFIGSSEASRSGAIKKIWEYVKSHNLQNPDNKREIYCDDMLKTIFDGKDKVDFPGIDPVGSVNGDTSSVGDGKKKGRDRSPKRGGANQGGLKKGRGRPAKSLGAQPGGVKRSSGRPKRDSFSSL